MRQAELSDLYEKQEAAQKTVSELTTTLAAHNIVCVDFETWTDCFDLQDTIKEKAMLINIIDKIVLKEDTTDVAYKIIVKQTATLDHLHGVQSGIQAKMSVWLAVMRLR